MSKLKDWLPYSPLKTIFSRRMRNCVRMNSQTGTSFHNYVREKIHISFSYYSEATNLTPNPEIVFLQTTRMFVSQNLPYFEAGNDAENLSKNLLMFGRPE